MNTNNAGGGEILQYVGNNKKELPSLIDENVVKQFTMLPGMKVLIIILLVVVAILLILKVLHVKNPLRGRAVTNELEHMDKIRKRDAAIIQSNKMIQTITKIIENSPFVLSKSYVDYWRYNLERANIRIPGGSRVIRPQEFNAIIKTVELILCAFCLLFIVLISAPIGLMAMLTVIMFSNTLPMQAIRSSVKAKDNEIIENFADFYLMIHYVLLASAGTPIAGIMKSYDKTTSSDEMHRFVDVCIHYIDTYGEYEATRYIAKQYREINQVGKLMRLIRQANEGGDVRAELMGFRDELLSAKKYALSKRMELLVLKAKASFNILVPILIQAIVSAMAIYIDDLGITSSFF